MQVDLGEALEYIPEDAAILQALELVGEQELVEKDVADIAGEFGDVIDEVLVELAGVLPFQRGECEAREVIDLDVVADGAEQDHVAGGIIHTVRQCLRGLKDGILGIFENAVQTAQDDERQDDLAVFGLFEVAAQDFRDRPDERAEILNLFCIFGKMPPFLLAQPIGLARSPPREADLVAMPLILNMLECRRA